MARNTLMGACPPLLLSCITEVVTIGLVGKEIKLLRSHLYLITQLHIHNTPLSPDLHCLA